MRHKPPHEAVARFFFDARIILGITQHLEHARAWSGCAQITVFLLPTRMVKGAVDFETIDAHIAALRDTLDHNHHL